VGTDNGTKEITEKPEAVGQTKVEDKEWQEIQ
jgi:hypothetical protein